LVAVDDPFGMKFAASHPIAVNLAFPGVEAVNA
jgi:hypothetical protein